MKNNFTYHKIGDVVRTLKKEYPDISASTIRYWEKLDLFKPSGKTEGKHRQYTDKDIETIKYIKELSLVGTPIREIRRKLYDKDLDQQSIELGSEIANLDLKSEIFGFLRKFRQALDNLKHIFEIIKDEASYEYVYNKEALTRLLGEKSSSYIVKAEEYGLIHPEKINGKLMYSKIDEEIIKTIIENNGDLIEKCKNLFPSIQFMTDVLKISPVAVSVALQALMTVSPEQAQQFGFKSKEDYKIFVRISPLFLLEHSYYQKKMLKKKR